MTNFEKIKAMTTEEMAELFAQFALGCSNCRGDGSCVECNKKWLEREVDK